MSITYSQAPSLLEKKGICAENVAELVVFVCLVRPRMLCRSAAQTNSIAAWPGASFTGRGVSVLRARAVERAMESMPACRLLRCSFLSRLTLFIILPSLNFVSLLWPDQPLPSLLVLARSLWPSRANTTDLSSRSVPLFHKASRETTDAQSLWFP